MDEEMANTYAQHVRVTVGTHSGDKHTGRVVEVYPTSMVVQLDNPAAHTFDCVQVWYASVESVAFKGA